MFGQTNPFGQQSSNPFGSQSVFGQTSNANNNPFTPKPFGSPTLFGAQTGGSMFGGTSTGVFGTTQTSSPLPSTPTFGATSTPGFGTSAPAFGGSPTPAFGSGSSSFGGTSAFGQKPAFGGFGSTPSQTSPFGSTNQQTQSAFGNNVFGSSTTPFGGASQPSFGATTTTTFGGTSTPAFGTTSPAFGTTTSPAFGNTGSTFGVSTAPAFGSGGVFGAPNTSGFGASTNAFGSTPTPGFGATTPASTPSIFGNSPAFGQSSPAFANTQFGTTSSPFGAQTQNSPFGSQAMAQPFASTGFGSQRVGSRVASYAQTSEQDGNNTTGKLDSISAMPVYKDKSHEELRWEDYQSGDKGGPNPAGQSASAFGTPTTQSNPFGASSTFSQSSVNPFSSTTSSLFPSKTPAFGGSSGFAPTSTPFSSAPFSTSSANPFSTTPSSTPSIFSTSSTTFTAGTTPSIFGTQSSSAFGSSPSLFPSAPGTTPSISPGLNFGNTQTAGLFQSNSSLGQTSSTFGQTTSSPFGQSSSPFGQSTTTTFGQSSLFNAPSTGLGGNLFSTNSTPSLLSTSSQVGFGQTTPSISAPFPQTQSPQVSGGFSFGNFGQAQEASSGFGATSSVFGQSNFGQSPVNQGNTVMQPTPIAHPFGTLPAQPQMSIGRTGSAPSVQYGISSMPVTDKAAPVRVSSLLTSRHISQRRTRLPARKYHPKNDDLKVPFYNDDEEAPSTPKADALYIPRENPRALVIRPTEKWPSRGKIEKPVLLKDPSTPVHENGDPVANDCGKDQTHLTKTYQKPNELHDDSPQKGDSYITLTGHRAGEAAIVYEHGADIEALMPKLRRADYYTEPRIQELAARERAEPGFCHHVKDFVVGRSEYGSIKFIGETDVRRLDLESLVQFNNREVIVYMDESKKPPIGQGLNKPAEVTLLNIKCFDKKTGKQCTEGPRVDKYKEMLMKKARDQGAEFVSYDPLKGEWKFSVNHFSRYSFTDEDDLVVHDDC